MPWLEHFPKFNKGAGGGASIRDLKVSKCSSIVFLVIYLNLLILNSLLMIPFFFP